MRLSERISQGSTSNLLESIQSNLKESENLKEDDNIQNLVNNAYDGYITNLDYDDNSISKDGNYQRIIISLYDTFEDLDKAAMNLVYKDLQQKFKDNGWELYVDYYPWNGDFQDVPANCIVAIKEIQSNLKESNNDVDIVSYNLTNGGYSNNADTVYGKLSDDTAYVYYPEMDLIEIYDEVPIELLHILYYNSENEDELPEDEYQRLVKEYQDAHLINTICDGPLFDKLHDKYYADDEVEEVYSDLDENTLTESNMASKYAKFCKSMELDPKDLDAVLEALDNLEGMEGDTSGEYQEIREYIYNDLMK